MNFKEYETKDYKIGIDAELELGYFESKSIGQFDAGNMWFSEKDLVEYDGAVYVPEEVIVKLKELGYNTGYAE